MSSQSHVDFSLSSTDRFLYQKLRCHLAVEGKTRFSSDDFRACGLEKFLHGDLCHAIGGVFAKWVHNKLIREVGRVCSVIPSNHLRKISLYEFVEKEA
ncbi:hypothetical protein MUP01_10855 [Candidatus Bathyarchaeota archaeon]|nr:hypothetical protein [Candidatus Bathyarchaeota archaeon]